MGILDLGPNGWHDGYQYVIWRSSNERYRAAVAVTLGHCCFEDQDRYHGFDVVGCIVADPIEEQDGESRRWLCIELPDDQSADNDTAQSQAMEEVKILVDMLTVEQIRYEEQLQRDAENRYISMKQDQATDDAIARRKGLE